MKNEEIFLEFMSKQYFIQALHLFYQTEVVDFSIEYRTKFCTLFREYKPDMFCKKKLTTKYKITYVSTLTKKYWALAIYTTPSKLSLVVIYEISTMTLALQRTQ